jgi:hypothetical protein
LRHRKAHALTTITRPSEKYGWSFSIFAALWACLSFFLLNQLIPPGFAFLAILPSLALLSTVFQLIVPHSPIFYCFLVACQALVAVRLAAWIAGRFTSDHGWLAGTLSAFLFALVASTQFLIAFAVAHESLYWSGATAYGAFVTAFALPWSLLGTAGFELLLWARVKHGVSVRLRETSA